MSRFSLWLTECDFVKLEQIKAMCQRGFGSDAKLEAVQELAGGTFNEAYLLALAGQGKVILRVAPALTADLYWDDVALMRREEQILPSFAAVAPLVPKIIMADFTHQVVERDYMFQTYIEGVRWSDIEDEVTPEENISLWQQCGQIVKRIHNTRGERFGYPHPREQFSSWSEVILDRYAKISENLVSNQIELSAFRTIYERVQVSIELLNEIQHPQLLHGDLWTFNLLVKRSRNSPTITGVIDVDRAWWGDPMADWIMFLLAIRHEEPEWQESISAFYGGYGMEKNNPATQIRQEIYKAMHIGTSVLWGAKNGDTTSIVRARRELGEIAQKIALLP